MHEFLDARQAERESQDIDGCLENGHFISGKFGF